MWYPFYYEYPGTKNFFLDTLVFFVNLPIWAVCYTAVWFIPAMFTNSLTTEAWLSGFIGVAVVPSLIVHLCWLAKGWAEKIDEKREAQKREDLKMIESWNLPEEFVKKS